MVAMMLLLVVVPLSSSVLLLFALCALGVVKALPHYLKLPHDFLQIGRASCRERV